MGRSKMETAQQDLVSTGPPATVRQGVLMRAASGATLIVSGLVMLAVCWSYPLGSLTQMGPGFIPRVIAIAITIMGTGVLWVDLKEKSGARPEPMPWRGVLMVSVAVCVFSALITVAGLVPTMFLTVAISMLADANARPLGIVIYSSIATLVSWFVFLVGLGLPITAFGG